MMVEMVDMEVLEGAVVVVEEQDNLVLIMLGMEEMDLLAVEEEVWTHPPHQVELEEMVLDL